MEIGQLYPGLLKAARQARIEARAKANVAGIIERAKVQAEARVRRMKEDRAIQRVAA